MYKAIIFDVDDTIFNFNTTEIDSMEKTWHDHGLFNNENLVLDEFWNYYRPINFQYWLEGQKKKWDIHQVIKRSFTDTLQKLEYDHSISHLLASSYWNHFCNSCHFEPGAKEVLETLNQKHQLAVISNGIHEAQIRRMTKGDILKFFNTLVISDVVGYAKPQKEIFELALNKLKVKKSEALYIGDSIEDDYHGAKNAGIDFCFYNRNKVNIHRDVKPTFVVENLHELKNLI